MEVDKLLSSHGSPKAIAIENKIDEYLERQCTVLWGEFFEIESTKGRRRAKEFILDLLIDLELTHEETG